MCFTPKYPNNNAYHFTFQNHPNNRSEGTIFHEIGYILFYKNISSHNDSLAFIYKEIEFILSK